MSIWKKKKKKGLTIFFPYHSREKQTKHSTNHYTIPVAKGENQQKWIGTWVANLATDQDSLTTIWGTQNIWQWKPEVDKKFRSTSLVLSCQSEVVFILKVCRSCLLSVRYKTWLKSWSFAVIPTSTTASNRAPVVVLALLLFTPKNTCSPWIVKAS